MHHVLRLNKHIRKDMEDINNIMDLCPESRRGRSLRRHVFPSLFSVFTPVKRPYIAVHARIGRGVGEYPTGRFKEVSENMKNSGDMPRFTRYPVVLHVRQSCTTSVPCN